MSIAEALDWGKKTLSEISTAILDTELLLAMVLDLKRGELITKNQVDLNHEQEEHFVRLVRERKEGKPIAYLTQSKEFFERSFYVDERVLIPRPETEELVELALQYIKENEDVTNIIDLGTGSGCIGITLALELPQKKIIGIDKSSDALAVAKINAAIYNCKNLSLMQANTLEGINAERSDPGPYCIVANLPYIGTESNNQIEKEVQAYEPQQALFSGTDGLDHYRKCWQQISTQTLNIKAFFMEISPGQAKSVTEEVPQYLPEWKTSIFKDLNKLNRFALITRN